jgi:arginine/lysine/ornithine decarboxylase
MDESRAKKLVNSVKARAEEWRGPARRDQDAAPIADALDAYWARDTLSLAIPAHRGGRGPTPEAARWAGIQAYRADAPMSHGVDRRDRAWKVQSTAEQLAADALGAEQAFFSTNGSSLSAHVAILGAVAPGETLVLARNSHKSAFAGIVMSGARPVYVEPDYDERHELAHDVVPDELERVLDQHREARAVMVCSPTLYGVSGDVRRLTEICHERDLPIVVDSAWALDYAFHDELPPSAVECGADLVIGSVHKSLSGLSQTSILCVQGDRIDRDRLQLCFELEESTSASTLLLSSIDGARRQMVRDGERLIGGAIERARRLREAIVQIAGLDLLGDEILERPGAEARDPTHVAFDVARLGITGYQAADWLHEHHQVEFELMDHRRLMALVRFGDTDAGIERVIAALRALSAAHANGDGSDVPRIPGPTSIRTETVVLPRDAYLGSTRSVAARDAVGEVSAEMVTPYPPGIPVLAPGERITEEAVDYLERIVEAGAFVEGAIDQTLDRFRVVA